MIRSVAMLILGLALVTAPVTARADGGPEPAQSKIVDRALYAKGVAQKVGGYAAQAGALGLGIVGVLAIVTAASVLVGSIPIGAAIVGAGIGYGAIVAGRWLAHASERWLRSASAKIERARGANVARGADTRGGVVAQPPVATGSSGGAAAAGVAR